mmetsp:Transcript_7574/g.17752  ORF Transcript_7574/g.17752 Transcript_7574/m.17752 type:complete len:235 (-) Transcript_7574:91-795(-)
MARFGRASQIPGGDGRVRNGHGGPGSAATRRNRAEHWYQAKRPRRPCRAVVTGTVTLSSCSFHGRAWRRAGGGRARAVWHSCARGRQLADHSEPARYWRPRGALGRRMGRSGSDRRKRLRGQFGRDGAGPVQRRVSRARAPGALHARRRRPVAQLKSALLLPTRGREHRSASFGCSTERDRGALSRVQRRGVHASKVPRGLWRCARHFHRRVSRVDRSGERAPNTQRVTKREKA